MGAAESSLAGALPSEAPAELRCMVQAAQEAGREIRAAWFSRKSGAGVVAKSNSTDLQTQTDRKCEEVVFARLSKAFPEHALIGEETVSEDGGFDLTDAPTFVVDPIDGTTNFVHTVLSSSVLIACMVGKEVQQAVILDPIIGELFYAWRGGGAWLQRLDTRLGPSGGAERLQTSGQTEIGSAMLGTDLGYERSAPGVNNFLEDLRTVLVDEKVRGLRVCGGCGLMMARVAAGQLDAYFEFGGPHIWDYAAGCLIVTEAGGVVCDPGTGGPVDWNQCNIMAGASQRLTEKLFAALERSRKARASAQAS